MANRINRNIRWVKRQLDLAGLKDVLEEEILDAMSSTELECMERTGKIKDIVSITFDNVGPHALGVYALAGTTGRIIYISAPSNWSSPLVLSNSIEAYEKTKIAQPTGTQPIIALQMNDALYFWPVGTAGEVITYYAMKVPLTPYSQAEGVGDPLLGWGWDEVLRLGALSKLLPPGNGFERKFEETYKTQAHSDIQDSAAPILTDKSSRRLGF